MKVLLFSNDLMPFGNLPTSGGGLRCYQLMKGLEAHGIEVIASMPGFTYLAEKHMSEIPEEQRRLLWRWETQDEIYRREKPDAVLFASNWDHFNLSVKLDVPLIIDLHGSRLIETTMWGNPCDTEKKVKTFARADCLLCAGQRQQYYFSGWLVQAGRVPEESHFIRYIPVSLGPDMPEHLFPDSANEEAPSIVSGGGWFPWQNQSRAIFAACKSVADRRQGAVHIYGTPHNTATISPEEEVIRGVYRQVEEIAARSPRVKVHGYIGRNDLIEVYRRAGVALEVMRYNLEREFAFTTRTIEYLWCGLPVMYNNYGEIAGHIAEYDAGWTVNPDSDAEIALAIDEILSSPEALRRKSENAQRLVRDRFTWDKTITPLLDFLRNPVRVRTSEAALGSVFSRPAFLSPRAGTFDVVLPPDGMVLNQEFVVPAENIGAIDLPLSDNPPLSNNGSDKSASHAPTGNSRVRLSIRRPDGSTVCSRTLAAAELQRGGSVSLHFPLLKRPAGGDRLTLEIQTEGAAPFALLQGMAQPRFPFSPLAKPLAGKTLLGESIPVQAIVLHFLPAGGRWYRLQEKSKRAAYLIRRGEWRRLVRAAWSRVPRVFHRVRYALTSRFA